MKELIDSLASNIHIKIILGTIASFYVDFLNGNASLPIILFCFISIDTIFGLLVARQEGRYCPDKFYKWIIKVYRYCIIIPIAGLAIYAFESSIGYTTPILNILVASFIATEFQSIIKKMKKLGYPIHQGLVNFAYGFKSKSDKTLTLGESNESQSHPTVESGRRDKER